MAVYYYIEIDTNQPRLKAATLDPNTAQKKSTVYLHILSRSILHWHVSRKNEFLITDLSF